MPTISHLLDNLLKVPLYQPSPAFLSLISPSITKVNSSRCFIQVPTNTSPFSVYFWQSSPFFYHSQGPFVCYRIHPSCPRHLPVHYFSNTHTVRLLDFCIFQFSHLYSTIIFIFNFKNLFLSHNPKLEESKFFLL